METFGSTFGGHFFRSQKSQNVFLVPAPGLGLSATPPGEGGNLEARCQRRPGGGSEGKCTKTILLFCHKWRERPYRVHESVVTLTVYHACALKLADQIVKYLRCDPRAPYRNRQNTFIASSVLGKTSKPRAKHTGKRLVCQFPLDWLYKTS